MRVGGVGFAFAAVGIVVAILALWLVGVVALPGLGRFERAPVQRTDGDTLTAEGGATSVGGLSGRGDASVRTREASDVAEPSGSAEVLGSVETGGSVRGRVVREPGDLPVEGARVALRRPDSTLRYLGVSAKDRYDLLEARSGMDGRFHFRGVRPADGYVVRASLGAGATVTSPEIDLRGGVAKEVGDLVLGPAGRLEGRVTDGAGEPIGDARIAVSWPVVNPLQIVLADPETLEEIERETRTKKDGSFALADLEPGEKTVIVSSSLAGADVRFVTLVAGETTTLDVVLQGGRAIAGRVEYDDGSPVAHGDARVYAARMGQRVVRTAECDTGTFRIEHVPDGKYRLGVLVPGLPAKLSDDVVEPGTENAVVRFPTTGAVDGLVVAKGSGAPVRRFAVRIVEGPGSVLERVLQTMMGRALGGQPFESAEGRFRIARAFPGKTRLLVAAEGYPDTTTEPFDVVSGQTTGLRVEMPAGRTAHGVVRLPDGRPAAGAKVYVASTMELVGAQEGDEISYYAFDRPPDAVADDDGRFTLPPQTPGKYEVLADVPGHLQAAEEVDFSSPALSEIELRIPASGVVEGTVFDEAGRPTPGARVEIVRADGTSSETAADDAGRFRFEAERLGPAIVRWQSLQRGLLQGDGDEAAASYEALRREGGEVHIREGETARVSLRMPRLTRWRGRLLPPGGSARGFYVEGEVGGAMVPTDEAGRFETRLEPGTYSIWVQAGLEWSKAGAVEIPAGHDLERDVAR